MRPAAVTLPSPAGATPRRRRPRRSKQMASVLVLAAAACAVLRSVRRVEVAGTSMVPTFRPGDRLVVLARPFGLPAWPRVGDVVAVADPRLPERILVKRVAAVDRAAGTVDVRGDAAGASTDSREFGPVARTALVGRVVRRYGAAGGARSGPRPTEYDRS
jgi:signal peptidase I